MVFKLHFFHSTIATCHLCFFLFQQFCNNDFHFLPLYILRQNSHLVSDISQYKQNKSEWLLIKKLDCSIVLYPNRANKKS